MVAARLSADGKQAILIDEHGDIQIRETGDGAIVRAFPGISQELIPVSGGEFENRAAISADSSSAAYVLPDGTVRVTSLLSGQHHDLTGPPASVVAYAAGRLLVSRQTAS